MPDYRAYIIGDDGHFASVEFLRNHPDDATAIDGHDIELWDRDRFVGRFSPEPE
jgi:hypothetical protein